MHLNDIKQLILEHQEEVLSCETKSERLEAIIGLLDRFNPDVSLNAALNGSIVDFVDKVNHIEIQPVLQTLRTLQSMGSDVTVIGNSVNGDIEEIVNYIQQFIAKKEERESGK